MILNLILLAAFCSLALFYVFFLQRILSGLRVVSRQTAQKSAGEFISVIIPFRNEKSNLFKSLDSISSQTLSKDRYEVLYVDDNSDDGSFELLAGMEKPENIRLIKSPAGSETRGHKKLALQYAIERSKGEIIITTDADCTHDNEWLNSISSYFDKNTGFVSGPVKFSGRDRIFDNLQELEFSSLILVGAGLIGIDYPIICNAANLGFRKSAYLNIGGYSDNISISSGDDEFLMQKIWRETDLKIKFCFRKNAIAHTNTNETITDFYNQRKRWSSKGFYYSDKRITVLLVLIYLFYLSMPAQLILGLVQNKIFLLSGLLFFLIKTVFEYRIIYSKSTKLFPKPKILYFAIAEFLHVPYIIISGISGLFGNYRWKDRKIKR